MHLQPVFTSVPYYGAEGAGQGQIAEHLFDNGLCLPSGSNLSDQDRERIAKVVSGLFSE